MTKVIIVGEIYNAGLEIGGGPIIPPGGGASPPLGIWGGPWQPPHPSQGPGFPTHPIAPGGPPLGTWGGVAPPHPDQGLPQPPLGTWGGGNVPYPTPPIYIPAQPILPDSGDPTKAHIVVYVPGAGAVSFTVDLTQLPEPTPPTEPEPK